jgi:hypothetical protein
MSNMQAMTDDFAPPHAAAPATPEPYWVTADTDFSMSHRCRIRHNYHRHPLMQLDRLEQLARSLMATEQCRFIVPGSTDASTFDHKSTPADGRSVEDVFRRMHEPGSWVALYNVQTDPVYERFLRDVLGSAERVVQDHETAYDVRGFIFISAPPSVTPFHMDRENNFWLQIRGRKTLSVWDHRDRATVAARDVETFINYRSLDNVRLTDAARSRAGTYDCGPGDGVYFPSTSPHMTHTDTSWVSPEDGVVVSIGVVFYSNVTRRNAYAHAFISVRRRFGLNPRLAGTSEWVDRVKYPFGRVVVALRRRFQGYTPPPGF